MKALTQAQAALLHGRDEAVAEILRNCIAGRFTVVSSEAGMGVTSLLQAGVDPAMRREGFIVATFSDWQGRFFATNLKEAIAQAVRESADPQFFTQSEPFDEMLEHISARTGKHVAVLLDQFEDYLRCHANTVTSDLFDAELARAVAARKGVFVVGLQEHAIPAFERMEQHIPNPLGFHVQLAPLSVEVARAAVVSEARSMGMEVEPVALNALSSAPTIIRDKGGPDVDLVHPFFLKLAMGQLLEAEAQVKSTILRASTIELRGGVDRVVLETFDPLIGKLDKAQTELLFRWCTILISPAKERLAVTERKLTDQAGRSSRLVPALLKKLIETGILRSVETPEATRYEIARECFVPILHDWWERRKAAMEGRHRAIFRISSILVAVSAILLIYLVWTIFAPK